MPLNISFATPSQSPQHITLTFDRPFTARGLCLASVAGHGSVTCVLEISDDDNDYRPVVRFVLPRRGMPNINFPAVTARHFRLAFTGEVLDRIPFVVSRIDLVSGYRLPGWAAKAGFALMDRFTPNWDDASPPEFNHQRQDIVDISAHLKADGALAWDVPAGDWTILRFGYAPNGSTSMHPEPEGSGLEVDKMNPKALDAHFEGLLDAVLRDLGPLAGKSLTTIMLDSYEVGPQNWTGAFRAEFGRRCGYDIVPFLPALTGRVVDNSETTERFLWDVRHTIAALFAENYFGHFRSRCHQKGLKIASEPYIGPFSPLECGLVSDLPIGEFWTGKLFPENKSIGRRIVASAHLRGSPLVGAEAFTSRYDIDRFTLDPAALKADGDAQFCEGITRFVFHRFAHQPWLDKAPGMSMGPYGLHFERTVTWWESARAWIEYITRSQHLLQTGKPVTDVLCFDGEDGQAISRWGDGNMPAIPAGYDFEFTNAAFLLTAKAEDGAIELTNGVRYRLLLLPEIRHLTLPLARKLAALVKAGAVISGPPPLRSPSLSDHAAAEFARIVAELWGDCDGKTVTRHLCGKGAVYWGLTLPDVLAARGITPDFVAEGSSQLLFKHRTTPNAEIYFVSNQEQQNATVTCRFRVRGKTPEIWNPETGDCQPAALYQEDDQGTAVPLTLGPAGSLFVIFPNKNVADHAVAASDNLEPGQLIRAGKDFVVVAPAAGRYTITTAKGRSLHADVAAPPVPLDISQRWTITFPAGTSAPKTITLQRLASLSLHPDSGVRYFSGTATYTKSVEIPAAMLGPTREITIDLGDVKNLARLRINGIDFGVLWKPPFRCRVTAALKPGMNHIEVQVTDLWVNRLIGDEQLPDDCAWIALPDRGAHIKEWPKWLLENTPRPSKRVTFATWKFFTKEDALVPSGLIGPVRFETSQKVLLHP